MSTTNFPSPMQESQPKASSNSGTIKNVAIGVLAAGVLGLGAYTWKNNSETTATILQQKTQIAKVVDEKSDLQTSFDASLARLDSMTTENTNLNNKYNSTVAANKSEIKRLKNEIRGILNNKKASTSELARAKGLINELNEKIAGLEAEVARLTTENQTLANDKVVLTQEKEKLTQDLVVTTEAKQVLEKKVDVASTLHASNIAITPIDVRRNGKEKVNAKAKKVDKLMVSFDVTNKIAASGSTDVYVVVIGPDGTPITSGAETFTTRENDAKAFTARLPIEIETDKKKNVEFAFAPGTKFAQGSYKIQIYQNGFLIGEGIRELRKGGLFS
jgi:uncharacterized small protein (DUF1192 family)